MKLFNIFNKKNRSSRSRSSNQEDGYEGLIASKELKSPATEAYRVLRTNIHYTTAEDELRSLMFTSAGPGEGKSTTSANTAIVMAQSGKKVVLVDCDLRKPSQHRVWQLERASGVTNVLVENWKIDDVLIPTKVPNLSVILSGPIPPNPAELLGTAKYVKFIESLKERFDIVIIDAPPTIAVTDASVIASKVDGVVVLNKMEVQGSDYYYYYYYGQSEKAS